MDSEKLNDIEFGDVSVDNLLSVAARIIAHHEGALTQINQRFAASEDTLLSLAPKDFCMLFFNVENSRTRYPGWSKIIASWMELDTTLLFPASQVEEIFSGPTTAALFLFLKPLITLIARVEQSQSELFEARGIIFDSEFTVLSSSGESSFSHLPSASPSHSFVVMPVPSSKPPFFGGGASTDTLTRGAQGDLSPVQMSIPHLNTSNTALSTEPSNFGGSAAAETLTGDASGDQSFIRLPTSSLRTSFLDVSTMNAFMAAHRHQRAAQDAVNASLIQVTASLAKSQDDILHLLRSQLPVAETGPVISPTDSKKPGLSKLPKPRQGTFHSAPADSVHDSDSVSSLEDTVVDSTLGSGSRQSSKYTAPLYPDAKSLQIEEATSVFCYGSTSAFDLSNVPTLIYLMQEKGLVLALPNRSVLSVQIETKSKSLRNSLYVHKILRPPPPVLGTVKHMLTQCQFPRSMYELDGFFEENLQLVSNWASAKDLAPAATSEEANFRMTVYPALSKFYTALMAYGRRYVTPDQHVTRYTYILVTLITLFNSAFLWEDTSVLGKINDSFPHH